MVSLGQTYSTTVLGTESVTCGASLVNSTSAALTLALPSVSSKCPLTDALEQHPPAQAPLLLHRFQPPTGLGSGALAALPILCELPRSREEDLLLVRQEMVMVLAMEGGLTCPTASILAVLNMSK